MTVGVEQRSFLRLIFRWKGSLWKAIWKELIVFLAIYLVINVTYRTAMNELQKKNFETIVFFVADWMKYIPLQFLLGFFVSYIIGRWWDQLSSVPTPDRFLYALAFNLPGNDEKTRIIRRTIARWANLHSILLWREVCMKVKKRFYKDQHMLDNGLMTAEEYDLYSETTDTYGRWFLPVSWIGNQLAKCYDENMITDEKLQTLIEELYSLRGANGMLAFYDWINAPLRYIQITTAAVYGYFLICVLGRQGVRKEHGGHEIDIYFPLISVMEFIFYVGWLKVAELNRSPFNEDDDAFDMNYMLDRNLHVSFMIVDEMAQQLPSLSKDKFFNDRYPLLRHTRASYPLRDSIPNWSGHNHKIPKTADIMLPEFDHRTEKPPGYENNNLISLNKITSMVSDHIL